MIFGAWKKIGIPKTSLLKLIEAFDEDQDGFVTVGEVAELLKKYAKDVRSSGKDKLLRRR